MSLVGRGVEGEVSSAEDIIMMYLCPVWLHSQPPLVRIRTRFVKDVTWLSLFTFTLCCTC